MRTRRILAVGLAALDLMLVMTPPATRAIVEPALPSDFNGDGYADLAVGVPYEDVGDKAGAGAVNVLYGSSTGITAARDQYWTQDSPGVKGVSEDTSISGYEDGEFFGHDVASGDFDADGHADLAIMVLNEDRTPGAINVLYGSASGLTSAGDQYLNRATFPKPDWRQLHGRLAAGDFDGDRFWDLAVPLWLEGYARAVVGIARGGPAGLAWSDEAAVQLCEGPECQSVESVAAGDLNGDGRADLALGLHHAGEVKVLYGSSSGLSLDGAQVWTGDWPSSSEEMYGKATAIGDFDADGHADLAIGAETDWVGTGPEAGAVTVIYGSATGLVADGRQLWHQDAPGVPGRSEAGDVFGSSLATGDIDGDGTDDLAIGASGEGVGRAENAGAVTVLYGGPGGLGAVNAQMWTQDSALVPNRAEANDSFGCALAVANYGKSARDDLAIGAVGEDLSGIPSAGMVHVLYGRLSGLSSTNSQGWSRGSPGIRGVPEASDAFGWSLTP